MSAFEILVWLHSPRLGISSRGELIFDGQVIASATFGAVEDVADTAYTVTQDDNGNIKRFTSDDAVAVTISGDLVLPFAVGILQGGDGRVTVAGQVTEPEVTVNHADAFLETEKQYVLLWAIAVAQDEFVLVGRTAA